MGCRWWVKRVRKFRTLKKNAGKPFLDGVLYSWKHWDKVLDEVRELKPGDKIWNPMLRSWDEVKLVEFWWTPVRRVTFKYDNAPDWVQKDHCSDIKEGPILGKYISGFHIETMTGYYIYDSPSTMKLWDRYYGQEKD